MGLGGATRLEYSECPTCGYRVDAATGVHCTGGPSPGDVGLCIKCGNFNLYDDNLTLRLPTPQEFAKLKDDPDILDGQDAIRKMQAMKNNLK